MKLLLNPLRLIHRFSRMEASGGICMIIFAIAALVAANTSLSEWYNNLINKEIIIAFGEWIDAVSFKEFITDILMIFFFFRVGMELKKDMGKELEEQKSQIFLPIITAACGMAVPAIIYYFANFGEDGSPEGWAIPAATDIAFAVAVLLMVGSKLPRAAKTYLLAIAIFDDLGAIIIIALFYNEDLNSLALLWVAGGALVLYILNKKNVPYKTPYILTGIFLACMLYVVGIHATVAGVMTGIALPMRNKRNKSRSPLVEALKGITPWVNFLILPAFAFVSAGIMLTDLSVQSFSSPVTLGVILGLFFGKQIGIFFSTYFLVTNNFFSMPENTNFKHIYGVSIVAGIGFTMSMFVNMLAFEDASLQNEATLGILVASVLASLWGFIYLRIILGRKHKIKHKE